MNPILYLGLPNLKPSEFRVTEVEYQRFMEQGSGTQTDRSPVFIVSDDTSEVPLCLQYIHFIVKVVRKRHVLSPWGVKHQNASRP